MQSFKYFHFIPFILTGKSLKGSKPKASLFTQKKKHQCKPTTLSLEILPLCI
uniref:Uncharacterized protein n=1 Tax=Rhizophora mucronata TaxID=61149 RepID=A0A2P2NNP8_RHIMU